MISVYYDAILGVLKQPFNDYTGYISSFNIKHKDGCEETCMITFTPGASERFDSRKWYVDIYKNGTKKYGFTSEDQRCGAHKEHDIARKICTVLNNWFESLEYGCRITHVRGYDIFNTNKEDTMTNMTKAELEQKYWEAQRKIDEYERERDRFLKDIDERDQSISDLIDANEKLSKEIDKLSVDISREKAKHDAATEKCKEFTKDAEFWKGKAYEMDKKNCELRSRIWELKKELAEKSKQYDMRIEVTPETCYQIDILAMEVNKLEKENKNCKGRLDRIHEIIEEGVSNMTDEADNKKNPKEFREILVRECFGRPYYEILYKEDGKMHVGYSSYKLDKVSEWLKEFFID